MNYPSHILESIRVKIATDYLKRELRKYFPAVRGKEVWLKIDAEIESWFEKLGVRDFWNGFHGIAMGFKLKLGFIQVLTAENVNWKFEQSLPLDDKLTSGGDLKYISEELSEKRPRASRLREFFGRNIKLAKKWRWEFTNNGITSESRDNFPIIAMEEEDNGQPVWSIHDGNRRMILAVLQGKDSLSAYVGKYTTVEKAPQNFWLPTSFLMELVKEGELVGDYEITLTLLKKLIKLSQSGEYELRERVLVGQNEFRMKLKKGLGWGKN